MRYILFGLVLCATPVWAGNLCYTSSASEDAALADFATRDGLTQQQEINTTMQSFIASKYNSAVNAAVGTALANAWPGLSGAKKTAICTQLSVAVCPP